MISDNQINHNGSISRFEEIEYHTNANYVSEILAYNFNTPEGVFNGWLKSPNHLKQIEHKDLTHFGISVYSNDKNKNFFTMMFANINK